MIYHCLLHKSKSEVLLKFKKYVNSVEKHIDYQIIKLNILVEEDVKVLRNDNGGEYTSNKFTTFCADKGGGHCSTAKWCCWTIESHHNGGSKIDALPKLPLAFQAEACSTAVYLNNRSPTAALKDKTPFQRLFGRRPDISNLKAFGCVSYAHVPDSQRRQVDTKAHKAIFGGYPGVKGYKLYDLEKKKKKKKKKKFVVSRDVQFFEESFDHFDEKAKSDDAGQADLMFNFFQIIYRFSQG